MNKEETNGNLIWHNIPVEKLKKMYDTDLTEGLSSEEAERRLQDEGANELDKEGGTTIWDRIIAQINDFLIIILIAAAVVSGFLGETVDALVIIGIVIVNAVMGIIQESKAEKALESLQEMSAPEVTVIRKGQYQEIPSREIVKGDIVVLQTGDFVPADVRILEASNLRIDEASLTGESVPVDKEAEDTLPEDIPLGDRKNSAFMGTVVNYGRGRGLVVGTGMDTEIGKIAGKIKSYEDQKTPLQEKLDRLGKNLGIVVLIVCAVVFGVGLIRGQNVLEVFLTAVSLAVAAIPEGLPAVVTIVLALGMQRMVKRHVIIRKLLAVETLGTTTVICSDKTGTLTQNEMTVVKGYAGGNEIDVSGSGYKPSGEFKSRGEKLENGDLPELDLLLKIGTLCNDARLLEREDNGETSWEISGDPTEGALVVAASKAGYSRDKLEKNNPRVGEIPFDSQRKRMTTIHKNNKVQKESKYDSNDTDSKNRVSEINGADAGFTAFVKGAPDVILDLATHFRENGEVKSLTAAKKKEIMEINSQMAGKALRVLAGAYKPLQSVPEEPTAQEVEKDLIFVGLYGMIDPPRQEVHEAVKLCRKAGISPKLITGDYADTALAVAKELEITEPDGKALTGVELEKMSDEELVDKVEEIDVYARVSPDHKVRIVEALKEKGNITAMTGDGVNDALALKQADIGVAMGITGTDVAKQTAEMVLTDDNFASIVSAVEEGRVIYSNIRKFVYFLLSCNIGEVLVIFLSLLFGWPIPLVPVQILWVNLVTDAFPAMALGMEKGEPHIMDLPPRDPGEPILNKQMQLGIMIQGIVITISTLVAFYIGWNQVGIEMGRTMAFATLITAELLRAYSSRSERNSLFTIGVFSNKFMLGATALSFALLLIVLYTPSLMGIFEVTYISLARWQVILGLGMLPLAAAEITKLIIRLTSSLET